MIITDLMVETTSRLRWMIYECWSKSFFNVVAMSNSYNIKNTVFHFYRHLHKSF